MCKDVIYYSKHTPVRGIDISGKAGKVSKMTNAMDVRRLPSSLKTSKRFLRWMLEQASNNSRIGISPTVCQCIVTKGVHRKPSHTILGMS
ncbi:UNVERIFIED_CONTAM: hypothetical protein NCL1_13680 [Trichonephila clavipes]